VINVDLWDLLRSGDLSEDVILQEGDTITIPTATVLDPAEANQLAGASFSPNTIVVNVVGEVENQVPSQCHPTPP
jgi:polysaccharide export outer membrane protein